MFVGEHGLLFGLYKALPNCLNTQETAQLSFSTSRTSAVRNKKAMKCSLFQWRPPVSTRPGAVSHTVGWQVMIHQISHNDLSELPQAWLHKGSGDSPLWPSQRTQYGTVVRDSELIRDSRGCGWVRPRVQGVTDQGIFANSNVFPAVFWFFSLKKKKCPVSSLWIKTHKWRGYFQGKRIFILPLLAMQRFPSPLYSL
jgi:hypothetical protein